MQAMDILQSLFRWIHVGAGIVWIGMLYFFNFVNASFAATMDGDTKKKVVPELMPRALHWFRWGAAWTWLTGILLLLLVFYHAGILYEPGYGWGLPGILMVLMVFIAPAIYDAIMRSMAPKNVKGAVVVCFILLAVVVFLMAKWAHFSYRGYSIHVGGIFGTIMAFNVWMRIWPSQQKIITAIKNGTAPDPAVVALAGLRSRQNTYMSLPLLWMMLNMHTTWASGNYGWAITLVVVLFGWWIGSMLFRHAPKVKGF